MQPTQAPRGPALSTDQLRLHSAGPSIDLWPSQATGSDHDQPEGLVVHQGDSIIVRNVVRPTLVPYLPEPDVANGTAVVVAPGGGFHFLAWDYEGVHVAAWLAERGIAAFVLRYRVVDTGPTDETYAAAIASLMQKLIGEALELGGVDVPTMTPEQQQLAFQDGEQAMRLVREHASDWDLDPSRIGFLGFSAGAFVATAVAQSADVLARPDFVGAIYGGQAAEPVDEKAPPLFAVVTADDLLCRRTCIDTARAWLEAGRPTELHVFESGGHGFGARKLGLPVDGWMDLYADWLQTRGLLSRP